MNFFKRVFQGGAGIAIPVSSAAGQVLMVKAFVPLLVGGLSIIGISVAPPLALGIAFGLALILILATASQVAPPMWRQMSEWGQKLDNKAREAFTGKEYYLDTATQLYKDADKLIHSATDNINEIQRKVTYFDNHVELTEQDGISVDHGDKYPRKFFIWLYKLSTANGNKNDQGESMSHYSAREKISLATEKLNLARKLLSNHSASISNSKDQHTALGEKIESAKAHIMNANNSINKLEKTILRKNNAYFEEVTLDQMLKQSREVGQSESSYMENQKKGYKNRIENDSILPVDQTINEANKCISVANNKKAATGVHKECCTFYKSIKKMSKISSRPNKSKEADQSSSSNALRKTDEVTAGLLLDS